MFTLVFLFCSSAGQCFQTGPKEPFMYEKNCHEYAVGAIDQLDPQLIDKLSVIDYRCINWGEDS